MDVRDDRVAEVVPVGGEELGERDARGDEAFRLYLREPWVVRGGRSSCPARGGLALSRF